VAGLLRSCDQAWLALVRRWAGGAWLVLTVGMLAGAHWAYAELGWGGFWAWDPVENAALLPWLGATALLHTAMVDEHRGQVRLFTVALALITNVAALVGTLLTRSGAVSSVHAFAEAQAVGRALLGVVVVTAVGAGALLWRSRHRSEAQCSSGPSNRDGAGRKDIGFASSRPGWFRRQSVLTLNAALILGVAVVVAFGTLFPLVAEAAGGRPFALSGRFFALLSAPLALGALGLVGVAPVLRWRGGITPGGRRTLPLAATAALVGALVGAAAGVRQPFALAAVPLATFSAVLLVAELARRLRAPGPAVARRRAAGAILAHLGMVVLLAGVAGSTVGRTETVVVAPGQEVAVGSYRLRHDGAAAGPQAVPGATKAGGHQNDLGHRLIRLDLTLLRGADEVGVLHPEQRVFEDRGLVLAETALRSTPLDDVLVAIRRIGDDGTAVLEVSVRPLVMWVWLGGIMLAFGGAFAAPPPNRRFDGEPNVLRAPAANAPPAGTIEGLAARAAGPGVGGLPVYGPGGVRPSRGVRSGLGPASVPGPWVARAPTGGAGVPDLGEPVATGGGDAVGRRLDPRLGAWWPWPPTGRGG
jgi:cytochrome c-type biogenesis protein CcmF